MPSGGARGLAGDEGDPGSVTAGGRSSVPSDILARVLARRDLSVAEAKARLAHAGVAEGPAEQAVASALACGYLDDARLAERLVEKELARRPPPAPELVRERLEARGLAREIAAAAVRARADRETVAALVAEYVRAERGRSPARRILGRLARLGHEPETVEALLGDRDADDGDV